MFRMVILSTSSSIVVARVIRRIWRKRRVEDIIRSCLSIFLLSEYFKLNLFIFIHLLHKLVQFVFKFAVPRALNLIF